MIVKLVQIIVQIIKRDKTYEIKNMFPVVDLFSILRRSMMVIRGTFVKLLLRSSGPYLFVGKRVTLKHKGRISCGRGVTIGDNVVIDALSREGITVGDNVNIPDNSFIRCTGVISELGEGITIGDNVGLGHFTFINAQGGVVVGNDVIMGPNVSILAENHNFESREVPIRKQGVTRIGIVIEENVWIGAGCTILDGVTIGKGSVVAAGSLVNKNVLPNTVVAGCPARPIKSL